MKLTPAQKRMIARLQKAEKIARGVGWYITYTDKRGRWRCRPVDGRVCNALERAGMLHPIGGNAYRIVDE